MEVETVNICSPHAVPERVRPPPLPQPNIDPTAETCIDPNSPSFQYVNHPPKSPIKVGDRVSPSKNFKPTNIQISPSKKKKEEKFDPDVLLRYDTPMRNQLQNTDAFLYSLETPAYPTQKKSKFSESLKPKKNDSKVDIKIITDGFKNSKSGLKKRDKERSKLIKKLKRHASFYRPKGSGQSEHFPNDQIFTNQKTMKKSNSSNSVLKVCDLLTNSRDLPLPKKLKRYEYLLEAEESIGLNPDELGTSILSPSKLSPQEKEQMMKEKVEKRIKVTKQQITKSIKSRTKKKKLPGHEFVRKKKKKIEGFERVRERCNLSLYGPNKNLTSLSGKQKKKLKTFLHHHQRFGPKSTSTTPNNNINKQRRKKISPLKKRKPVRERRVNPPRNLFDKYFQND